MDSPESFPRILFRRGFKYQLAQDYVIQLEHVRPIPAVGENGIQLPFLKLTHTGLLTIRHGYAWDGASGPTRDTPSTFRGSLVHDALYQLMRRKLVDLEFRDEADDLFWKLIQEDGMWRFRAWFWWRSVRRFAEENAAKEDRPVEQAP